MSDLKLATDLAALILYLHEKTLRAAEGGPEKAEEWVKLRADYVSVCSTGAAVLAAALQDLSDSERGMREALEKIQGYCERRMSPPSYATHGKHIMAIVLAALSGIEPGEDEQARGQGRSAPISTDTKGATK